MAAQQPLSDVYPALTDERVSLALTKWFGEKMVFTYWQHVADTNKGDSYLSEATRVKIFGKTVSGNERTLQVVVKSMPKSVATRLTFRSAEFFKNEISFYENVLPGLLKFKRTKKLKEPFNNYAKTFLTHCDGEHDAICLEDATVKYFRNAMRRDGLDLEHCKVTFKAIAKFHALSFAMKDQEPAEFEVIKNAITETICVEELYEWYGKFWDRVCRIAIDAVETEYPNSIYVEKVKEFAVPERFDVMAKLIRTSEHGVILHGDCWTNNYLYKYDGERPIDTKMIDFQLARYGSPVLDISIIIYACTTQELRLEHYDELIKYYYVVLSGHMKELGSDSTKVYPWDVFMEEVKKYACFGLAVSFDSTPLIVLSPEESFNMDLEGDEKRNIDDVWQLGPFKTKEARLREANNIVHCVDNGYI